MQQTSSYINTNLKLFESFKELWYQLYWNVYDERGYLLFNVKTMKEDLSSTQQVQTTSHFLCLSWHQLFKIQNDSLVVTGPPHSISSLVTCTYFQLFYLLRNHFHSCCERMWSYRSNIIHKCLMISKVRVNGQSHYIVQSVTVSWWYYSRSIRDQHSWFGLHWPAVLQTSNWRRIFLGVQQHSIFLCLKVMLVLSFQTNNVLR